MDELPDLSTPTATAEAIAEEWGLELGEPFPLALRSFVAPAGSDAVLKVTPVEDDEADEEADALALWDGDGSVRLLRHDRFRRAALIERAKPGTDLSEFPEEEATAIAVSVGLRLWRPAASPFRWIGDHVPRWLDSAEHEAEPGSELIPWARELYSSLDAGRTTLIHGDFHHHNILDAGGGRYVAIDPKPFLGEPEYDVWSFMRNPLAYRMQVDVSERRIAAFAAAGLNDRRIRAWVVIRAAFLGVDEDEEAVVRAIARGL